MKIVIDARMINAAGIGRYLRNLLKELQKLDNENQYFILLLKEDFENPKFLDSLFQGNDKWHKIETNFRWYTVAEQIKLPKILNQIKPDLVHFPHFNIPIIYHGKFVATIHDLIHQHFQTGEVTTRNPLTFKIKRFGYAKAFRTAINKSLKILTPSEFVKKQLIGEWHVDGEKIIVTPEGVDDKLISIAKNLSPSVEQKTLEKLRVKPPFIFYVGNAFPHKNVEGLIKAFLLLRRNYQYMQLILSGRESVFWDRIIHNVIPDLIRDPEKYGLDSRLRGNDNVINSIIYTGEISDEELVALYKNAKCFVMPSFEEGFGLPLLEAFSLGCPVVSSKAGSLPEVGGDSAIYFDPKNVEEMSEKIQRLLNNEKLRKSLIEKGKERVKQFSWQKMAQQTLNTYKEILKQV